MNVREIERDLTERGFCYVRTANHGAIWEKKGKSVMVSRKVSGDHRALRNLLADIRRADPTPEVTATVIEAHNSVERAVGQAHKIIDMPSPDYAVRQASRAMMQDIAMKKFEEEFVEMKTVVAEQEGKPEFKERLTNTPMSTRRMRGQALWEKLSTGHRVALDREEITDLFVYHDFTNPHSISNDILNKREFCKVDFIEVDGKFLFDAECIVTFINSKTKKEKPMSHVSAPIPTSRTVTLEEMPKWALDFYATLARKRNTTLPSLFAVMLTGKAESEKKKVDELLAKEFEARRQELLAEVDLDL